MSNVYRPLTYREELTALRDRSGLTQLELAHELRISRSAWQKYEYGQRSPRRGVQSRITELMMKYPA
jgi:transcriptional regulator with XRE-family HTH domain